MFSYKFERKPTKVRQDLSEAQPFSNQLKCFMAFSVHELTANGIIIIIIIINVDESCFLGEAYVDFSKPSQTSVLVSYCP